MPRVLSAKASFACTRIGRNAISPSLHACVRANNKHARVAETARTAGLACMPVARFTMAVVWPVRPRGGACAAAAATPLLLLLVGHALTGLHVSATAEHAPSAHQQEGTSGHRWGPLPSDVACGEMERFALHAFPEPDGLATWGEEGAHCKITFAKSEAPAAASEPSPLLRGVATTVYAFVCCRAHCNPCTPRCCWHPAALAHHQQARPNHAQAGLQLCRST
jgi:hypothetical protein